MAQVAKAAGLGRDSLYKALAPGSYPRFATRALNLRMTVEPPLATAVRPQMVQERTKSSPSKAAKKSAAARAAKKRAEAVQAPKRTACKRA
jgi:hypothetical protein